MRNRYLALLFSILAIVVPVIICFGVLMHNGLGPLLTNSVSFDAKVLYAQEKKIKQVNLLALGSSITLNNLSSKVIKDSINTSYFNFSCWGLQMADIKQLAINYVPKYKPKYLVVCSSIPDFTAAENSSITEYLNTNDYFKEHLKEYFYLKNYYSIADIRTRKNEQGWLRKGTNNYESLNFDEYGGVLLDIPKQNISVERWNLQEPFPTPYTNDQYGALISLSKFLKEHGVLLIFVQTPVKKLYVSTVKFQQAVDAHFNKCKVIIEENSGVYLNFHDPKVFNDSLFVDQFHLSVAGATLFTEETTHSIKNILAANSLYH